MLTKLFVGIALSGAEWVLYLLLILSVGSVALIIERAVFYRQTSKGLSPFLLKLRRLLSEGSWGDAEKLVANRKAAGQVQDFETPLADALLRRSKAEEIDLEVLNEAARESLLQSKLSWERNLAFLATIGSNAPFVGLFGTVLGIIHAFDQLSQGTGGSGQQTIIAGVAEALVATGIGIFVAIPAAVAFNLYQRRVKEALGRAEALKSYLISEMGSRKD